MDPRSWGLVQRQAASELRDQHNLEWLDNYDTGMICRLDTISARVPEKGLSREYYNMLHWGYARALRDSASTDVTRGFKFVAIAKTVTTGRLASGKDNAEPDLKIVAFLRLNWREPAGGRDGVCLLQQRESNSRTGRSLPRFAP